MRIHLNIFTVLVSLFACVTSARGQGPRDGQLGMYGIALPKFQVTMRSSIESQIQEIKVDEGQFVKQGEVLVVLDCRVAKARQKIAELEAKADGRLLSAQAELEFAESHLNRISKLINEEATTLREYEDANLRVKRARAALKIEQQSVMTRHAQLELATAELEQYFLRAPFDGQIAHVNCHHGQSVTQTDELLKLVSLDVIRLEIFLPMEMANQLELNRRYPMRINSPINKKVEGLAIHRSPMVDAATSTIRCVFEIDNRVHRIPAGATVVLEGQRNRLSAHP